MSGVQTVRVGEVDLQVQTEGTALPPLVLVHGYTGSRDDFAEEIPRLAKRRRVVAYDQRGHGDSSNPGRAEAYGFESLIADLEGIVDGLRLEEFHLLGHSMGGMVAMRYALANVERVRSLILMDTSAEPVTLMPEAVRQAGVKFAHEHGLARLADMIRAGTERSPSAPASSTACIQRMGPEVYWGPLRRKFEQMDVVAFDVLGALLKDAESISTRLEQLTMKTHVLVGQEDAAFRDTSELLARAIPDATLRLGRIAGAVKVR